MLHRLLHRRPPRRVLALAGAMLLRAAAGDASDGPPTLQEMDQQVANVGYRLAASAGDLCPHPVPLTGLAVQDLSQYPRGAQPAASATLGLGPEPQLLAVAAGSPAEAAGLRAGDALVSIDGQAPPPAVAAGSFDRVEATLRMLDAAAADGVIELGIRRGGALRTVRVALERGCASRFITAGSGRIGAAADGEYVKVSTATVRFAGSDAQLAAVLAHEFAHNILGHRARLAAGGAGRTRRVRETEDEADRMGVYLVDRAGYPPSAAVDFWTRYRAGHPLALLSAPDHSSLARRIAIVREEVDRIERMRARGEEPRPDFLAAATTGASR